MLPKTALLALFVVVTACAAHHRRGTGELVLREKSPGLFVGTSETGETVIAASHYDAMNGLALVDTDLGLEARKAGSGAMICRREVPTGSHVPHWMCRYTEDIEHERQLTLNTLAQPFATANVGGGGGVAVSSGSGGGAGTRTQQR